MTSSITYLSSLSSMSRVSLRFAAAGRFCEREKELEKSRSPRNVLIQHGASQSSRRPRRPFSPSSRVLLSCWLGLTGLEPRRLALSDLVAPGPLSSGRFPELFTGQMRVGKRGTASLPPRSTRRLVVTHRRATGHHWHLPSYRSCFCGHLIAPSCPYLVLSGVVICPDGYSALSLAVPDGRTDGQRRHAPPLPSSHPSV